MVVEWAQNCKAQHAVLDLLYAVPNGAKLPYRRNKYGQRYSREAQYLLAEGLRPGVPDLCLPVARKGYHGMYIEMKWGSNVPTAEQKRTIDLLRNEGYYVVVCWGSESAIQEIENYLGIKTLWL